jgi:hypothetical protein
MIDFRKGGPYGRDQAATLHVETKFVRCALARSSAALGQSQKKVARFGFFRFCSRSGLTFDDV